MTGPGASWFRGARLERLLLGLLVACAVTAFLLAPSGWQWPSLWGVLVAGATLARSSTVLGWPGRLTVYLIGGLLTAAAVTVWQPQSRAYGVAAFAAVVIVYPAVRLAEPLDEHDTRRRQLWGLLQGSAIGATIVVAATVGIGLFERNQASFAMRYGEQVAVTPVSWCVGLRGGTCPDSTWTIDGRTYTGALRLGTNEVASSPKEAWTVPGDTSAYTARHYSAPVDGLEPVGLVPLWLGVPVLLIMIAGALPARLWRALGRLWRAFGRSRRADNGTA